jgi:2-oxoisovalerate dehydrogenase E1 component
VAEIMFGDFLTLAFDQWLNHAAKFRYMYNERDCSGTPGS